MTARRRLLLLLWAVCTVSVRCGLAQEQPTATSFAAVQLIPATKVSGDQIAVPADMIAAAAIHPAQVLQSAGFRSLLKSERSQADWKFFSAACAAKLGLAPEQIERIEMGMDMQALVDLQSSFAERQLRNRQTQQLQILTAAMLSYHSNHAVFPSADGREDLGTPGLSWRVHLLPWLGEQELYQRFHLDEPWDSDHNKTLIEQMPEVYASMKEVYASVKPETKGTPERKGYTSLHVLAGEGMPFSGDEGPVLEAITDGAERTILVAVAGADRAEIWTKPGALEINGDAKSSLGKFGEEIPVGFMDGSPAILPADIAEDALRHLMNGTDGQGIRPSAEPDVAIALPGFAVRFAGPWNADLFCNTISSAPPREVVVAGQKGIQVGTVCILQPHPGFALIGSQKSVESMLKSLAKSSGDSQKIRPIFIDVASPPDLAAVINLQALQSTLTNEVLKGSLQQIVGDGPAKLTETVSFTMQLTDSARSIMDVRLSMPSETTAQQIAGLCVDARQWSLNRLEELFPEEEYVDVAGEWRAILQSGTAIASGNEVRLNVPAPANADQFCKAMEAPAAQILRGYQIEKTASLQREIVNRLAQVAYAMRGFQSTNNHFPPVDVPFDKKSPGSGLSWRVHLLPFLGEERLYKKFRLDEAWDSPHNKALIPEMPAVYASYGAQKDGRSALHVITGDKTPLGNPELKPADLTDGDHCTLMLVEAGRDTMDMWTKPGGLRFRTDAPKACLGTLTEDFAVIFFNGNLGFLKASIADRDFTRLIQHQDGEPIDPSALIHLP